jgi:hypothetical protein
MIFWCAGHPYQIPKPLNQFKRLAERLNDLLKLCLRVGVDPIFETPS